MMSKRRAFTLLEMLVVIAITAVLAGILLPSLESVRELAKFGSCQANLKGIGEAMFLYAQDSDRWIPGNGGWWPRRLDDENVNWNRHLAIYDESAFVDDDTGFSGEHYNPPVSYVSSTSIFYCPEDQVRPDPNEWPFIVETSYGLNRTMTHAARNAGVDYVSEGWLFYNIGPTKHPDEMYLICDTDGTANLTWARRSVCTSYYYTAFRHDGRCNMLFFDGHVEALLDGEIRAEYHNIPGQYGFLSWYPSCGGPDNCAGNGNAGDGYMHVNGPEDLRLPWSNGDSY